jgi:hypothetical protein
MVLGNKFTIRKKARDQIVKKDITVFIETKNLSLLVIEIDKKTAKVIANR